MIHRTVIKQSYCKVTIQLSSFNHFISFIKRMCVTIFFNQLKSKFSLFYRYQPGFHFFQICYKHFSPTFPPFFFLPVLRNGSVDYELTKNRTEALSYFRKIKNVDVIGNRIKNKGFKNYTFTRKTTSWCASGKKKR